jgi:hypothetical protein
MKNFTTNAENPHQLWQIADVGSGSVVIRNNATGLHVTAPNSKSRSLSLVAEHSRCKNMS